MDEQTVTETEAEATPSAETTDAQADLDSLLSQYESETAPAEQETTQETTTTPDVVTEWATRQMAKEQQNEINAALESSTKLLKESLGDMGKNMPDLVAEGILHAEGRKNPAIAAAFQNRGNNPAAWESIVRAMGKKFADEMQPKDENATNSWDAVTSAVHSASTSTDTESLPDFSSMSDQEFTKWKMKHG